MTQPAKKSVNLLDLVSDADREKGLRMIERRRQQMVDPVKEDDGVTPEMFSIAEFGINYGWSAVVAIKNNEITFKEMQELNAAAKKVWYTRLIDKSHGNLIAVNAAMSQDAAGIFNQNIKVFTNKAEVMQ